MSTEAKELSLPDSSVLPDMQPEAIEDARASTSEAENNSVYVERAVRVERIVDYCVDPEQSLTNYRLVGVVGVCAAVIVVLSVALLAVTFQKPRLVIVDRTQGGDRVVVMDDRAFGLTDSVEFTKDQLTAQGKIYLVRNYLELLYSNNPDYRERQLEAALKLMVTENGRKFFRYLKEKHILEQEAAESWQATWSPQAITIDPDDPFMVRAIGVQKLRRKVGGTVVEEAHQLNLRVRIVKDELGREDRNLLTGYLVDVFDWDELKNPTLQPPPATTTSATSAQTTGPSSASVLTRLN